MSRRNGAVAKRIGANLRKRRQELGFSQDELARYSGLHRTEISLIERGEREPRALTIIKLVTVLDTSADVLLDGIDWQPPPQDSYGAITVRKPEEIAA